MRWAACEAELIQAHGRARAVNRTPDHPLQIDIINKIPLPGIKIDEVLSWERAQPAPLDVIAGRHALLLPTESTKGMANIAAALLPDMFGTENAARQAVLSSRAETPNKDYSLGVSAREGEIPDTADIRQIKIKAPGSRYAVPALSMRPLERRPVFEDEIIPPGVDINENGVLIVGGVYVLTK